MLEMMRTLPGRKGLNEPLMYETARLNYGFGWHKYIDPGADAPRQRRFMEKVLSGQLGISPAWSFEAATRPGQVVEHATRDKLVVKFCRLNRMLHWFANQFQVQELVFIVRHPCAVISSMLRHGAWNDLRAHGDTRWEQALHGGSLPDSLRDPFEPILEGLSDKIEVLAVHWCLDHYVPLVQHAQSHGCPWILVPYERLVMQGRAELRRIAEALGVEVTEGMRGHLNEPSSSVRDRVHTEADRQLSKWRRRLSSAQVETILSIVDKVGLSDFYAESLEPDYERLNGRQMNASKW